MRDLLQIERVLAAWPMEPVPAGPFTDASLERLRRVLEELRGGKSAPGSGDLAGLIRHALCREVARGAQSVQIRVPRRHGWPTREQWVASGMDVPLQDERSFLLRPTPWHPEWLEDADVEDPLLASFAEVPRRADERVPADPALEHVLGRRFATYTSPGQRAAVRSALCARPGAKLLINLPTGAGKSLVAWAPVLLAPEASGVSVVIVPTVALALDQERQLRALLAHQGRQEGVQLPLAWHAGLEKTDRQAIRRRIGDGTQPVVLCSPEGAVRSLASALYDAASKGFLRSFVIDEAHLIGQWGNEFRPEFQAVAGVCNDLRRRCPAGRELRTVLMTATMTEDSYRTIATLFGPAETLETVSAVHLRPEPSYWIHRAADAAERTSRILELVQHVPRPFLLYVSKREDVDFWAQELAAIGLRRVGCVHGKTESAERERIVSAWARADLDVVVATSAFGLGMDYAHVRAVIHACVPESVDRYYQEVGRAGRDGKACVSFLVYTAADLNVAVSLNADRIIGIQRGLQRWQQMLHDCEPVDDSTFRVDLTTRPPDIVQDSDANVAWNLRTLTLMARAGLITLDAEPPPSVEREEGESEDAHGARAQEALAAYFKQAVVRIRQSGHSDPACWEQKVEHLRQQSYQADRAALQKMRDVLEGRRELADILSQVYTVPAVNVWPSPACGGCSVCRGKPRSTYRSPEALAIGNVDGSVDERLRRALGGRDFAFVRYDAVASSSKDRRNWRRSVLALLQQGVQFGIREIAAEDLWLQDEDYCDLYRFSPSRFVLHEPGSEGTISLGGLALPRISLLEPGAGNAPIPEHLMLLSRPLHIVVAPEQIPDPRTPGRRYFDVVDSIRLEELLRRLETWVS